MTQINLPNRNITGDNLWSQVEDNDQAIVNTVNGAIDNGNIAAAADINASKLLDGSITAAKLGTDSVTNAKIDASAVNTAEIADDAVTPAKINLTITTDDTNSETTVTGTNANISGLSVSLTAGTYLIVAPVNVEINNNTEPGLICLYNQTDSAAIGLKQQLRSDSSGLLHKRTVTLVSTVTLAATKTIGVRIEKSGANNLNHKVYENEASITAVRIG